jgi:hypothetical protein
MKASLPFLSPRRGKNKGGMSRKAAEIWMTLENERKNNKYTQ